MPGAVATLRVAGIGMVSNDPTTADFPAALAAAHGLAEAGLGPPDLDVVEVHDAAAPPTWCLEEIGLRGEGEALQLLPPARPRRVAGCRSTPAAACSPAATRSAPPAAAQIVELADQLRGRAGARQTPGARIALAQNGGGILGEHEAVAVVTILERTR